MLQYGGLVLRDQTRFKNNGTLTNMDVSTDWVMSRVRGRSGRVLDFDGTNDRVKFDRHFSQLPLTLAAWFRVDSAETIMQLFCVGSTTSNNPLLCLNFRGDLAGDPISAQFRGETTFTNSASERTGVVVGRWHFGVAVFRGLSNRQVFLDGVAGAADTATYDSPAFNAMNLGVWERTAFLQWLDGQIAEACIWSRALTISEIQELYRRGPGWYQPQLPRRIPYSEQQAGFRAYWARRQSQLIGGGV